MENKVFFYYNQDTAFRVILPIQTFLGGRKKGKFPISGAIEVGQPGAGTELDADLSLGRKAPSG